MNCAEFSAHQKEVIMPRSKTLQSAVHEALLELASDGVYAGVGEERQRISDPVTVRGFSQDGTLALLSFTDRWGNPAELRCPVKELAENPAHLIAVLMNLGYCPPRRQWWERLVDELAQSRAARLDDQLFPNPDPEPARAVSEAQHGNTNKSGVKKTAKRPSTDSELLSALADELVNVEFVARKEWTPDAAGFKKRDRNAKLRRYIESDALAGWFPNKADRDRVVALARKEGWFAKGRSGSRTSTRVVRLGGKDHNVYQVRLKKPKEYVVGDPLEA